MAIGIDEIHDKLNEVLLRELSVDTPDANRVLRLAEARAWLTHPAQTHSQSGG